MAAVSLNQLRKSYDCKTDVLAGITLDIAQGEFVVLVGPSGCGKSTLMNIIAGLEEPSGGLLRLEGRDITQVAPAERNISMVFQSYALYPNMTVAKNIEFPLEMRKVGVAIPDTVMVQHSTLTRKDEILDQMASEQGDPTIAAKVELLNAQTRKTAVEAVNKSVEAMYSATQAGNQIAMLPAVAPLARDGRNLVTKLQGVGERIDSLVGTTGEGLASSTLPRLNVLLQELTTTSRQLSDLLDEIDDSPQLLLLGRRKPPPGPGEAGFGAAAGAQ